MCAVVRRATSNTPGLQSLASGRLSPEPRLQARPQVNSLGKWKTALQMVAMSLLLVLRNADHLLGSEPLGEPVPQGVGPSTRVI